MERTVIGIDVGGNIACAEHLLELLAQSLTTIIVDIELHPIGADDS